MPQKLLCPHCRLAMPLEEARAGATATCPFCEGVFRVPAATTRDTTAPPLPPRAAEVPFFIPPAMDVRPDTHDSRPPTTVPPPIPQVRVVQEEEEYDPTAARRRRAPDRHPPADDSDTAPFAHTDVLSRKDANQWRTVQSGLALVQFGYILSLLSALALFVMGGPFLASSPPASEFGRPGISSPGMQPFFCGSSGCLLVGLVLLVVGQAMLCAAPHPPARSCAVISLVLLLSTGLLSALQFLTTTSRPPMAMENRIATTLDVLVLLLAVVLMASSHIVFVVFLQALTRHFRDVSARRQAFYYQVFYLIYLAVSVFTLAINYHQHRQQPAFVSTSSRPGELTALAALCWGCFGIFLLIALISIVQQARSILRDRLQLDRRRRSLNQWPESSGPAGSR